MKIRRTVILLLIAFVSNTAVADACHQLPWIVNRQNAVLTTWRQLDADVRKIEQKLNTLDSRYRFVPEPEINLTIGEFETRESFQARLRQAEKAREERKKKRVEELNKEKEKERSQMTKLLGEKKRQRESTADEWRKELSSSWIVSESVKSSDLPYFTRSTMSFENIPFHLLPALFKDEKMKFECSQTIPKLSLQFDSLSEAETFKRKLSSGTWELILECECRVGAGTNAIIVPAWTERVEKSGTRRVAEFGIAAAILYALGGGSGSGYQSYGTTPSNGTGFLEKYKIVEHPALEGTCYPLELVNLQCHIVGPKNQKAVGIKTINSTTTSSLKWTLVCTPNK